MHPKQDAEYRILLQDTQNTVDTMENGRLSPYNRTKVSDSGDSRETSM